MEDLIPRIATYIGAKLNIPANDITITDFSRIPGGASRETYKFRASWTDKAGKSFDKPLILRRDPTGSLIDTDREIEFAAFQTYYGTKVPVPEALWLEQDEGPLDRPFFMMEQIEGGSVGNPFNKGGGYGDHADKLGEQFWPILGHIAALDPEAANLSPAFQRIEADKCWEKELDYWANEIATHQLEPQPVAEAAIRWLRRNPPPPAQAVRVVHGDYRTGNFLFNDQGDIIAVLDWEMAHLGDPLEDLCWALDPLWCVFEPEKPGNMIERARALELWQQASGLTIDPVALEWWEVFSMVKGLGIWITGAYEYETGDNKAPILGFSAWWCTDTHNRLLADRLKQISEKEG
ncbi:MAG: phosphotransferase family protein [Alphaproteobacteria bacterium]